MSTGAGAAPSPSAESQRLQALRATGLLDTAPEQVFDDLVQLAATVCEAPISLISLVDRDRQWFKARVGLDLRQTPREVSFCSIAIQQDGFFAVPDTHDDARFSANPLVTGPLNLRAYASFPVSGEQGERLGTLCVLDHVPRRWTAEQEKALSLIARQITMQIDLRMQLRTLDQVLQERECFARELEVHETRFRAFLDACPAPTIIKDEDGRMLYCNRAVTAPHGAEPRDWIGRTDADLWPEPYATRWREQDQSVQEGGKLVRSKEQSPGEHGRTLHWDVYKFPFADTRGGRFVAGVSIEVTREYEMEMELRRSRAELQQANQQLTLLAVTDALTQVKNRRAFDEALAYEMARSRRTRSPLSLLMLDIDSFKSFNDSFGHVSGDQVLREVAALLRSSVRSTDSVARYGGEEFTILLPDTSENEAFHLASRLCEIVEEHAWELRPITVSIGVGALVPSYSNPGAFVKAVDRSLYEAKRRGKNQAYVPTPSVPSPLVTGSPRPAFSASPLAG